MVNSKHLSYESRRDVYTREQLNYDASVVRCKLCGTFALEDSWKALPGCARYGCRGQAYWTPQDAEFWEENDARLPEQIALQAPEDIHDHLPGQTELQTSWDDTASVRVIGSAEPESRYTRLQQLGWDPEILRHARALVVGAGALGNEILKNLALLGWGHIIVVDMDTIESTNLSRSVLFRQGDVGSESYKSVIAAQRVRDINPDVHIVPVVGTVQDTIGLGVYRRVDVVFGCLDNRQARLDVSKACWKTLTPFIDGGLDRINGDVRTFVPPFTACYGCTLSSEARKRLGDRHSCLKVKLEGSNPVIPTAPTISSIIAAWQTQIAVKHIHGRRIPAGQRIMVYGEPDVVETCAVQLNPSCPDHDEITIHDAEITELPFSAATTTIRDLAQHVQDTMEIGEGTWIKADFTVLATATCTSCGLVREFNRRLTSVWINEVTCPECGKLMRLDIGENVFFGHEAFADRPLAEIGAPPLHIFEYGNRISARYGYVELTGDLASLFLDDMSPLDPKIIPVYMQDNSGEMHLELLPKRVPVQSLISWRAPDWLGSAVSYAGYSLRNITQGFDYGPLDSLQMRNTNSYDTLRINFLDNSQ